MLLSLQQIAGNRAVRDLVQRSRTPGEAPAAAGRRLLSVQQTAGNRAVSGLMQRVRERAGESRAGVSPNDGDVYGNPSRRAAGARGGVLQRVANYQAKDKTAEVMVDDSANRITVTGSAKDEHGAKVELSGWLKYKQAQIAGKAVSSGSRKDARLAGHPLGVAALAASRAQGQLPKGALEIEDVVAQPRGKRMGQLLAWHLARNARAQQIDYVVAGTVLAPARAPFYVPLGFRDFKDSPSWKSLDTERAKLKEQIDAGGPEGVAQEIWDEYHRVRRAIAANKIFVSTTELEEKAHKQWSERWLSE